jgi:hypothetical protein
MFCVRQKLVLRPDSSGDAGRVPILGDIESVSPCGRSDFGQVNTVRAVTLEFRYLDLLLNDGLLQLSSLCLPV